MITYFCITIIFNINSSTIILVTMWSSIIVPWFRCIQYAFNITIFISLYHNSLSILIFKTICLNYSWWLLSIFFILFFVEVHACSFWLDELKKNELFIYFWSTISRIFPLVDYFEIHFIIFHKHCFEEQFVYGEFSYY